MSKENQKSKGVILPKIDTKILMIVLPVFLILSTSLVFFVSAKCFGTFKGYIIGFVFYWIFWCLWIPRYITKLNLTIFFKVERPLIIRQNKWIILALLTTLIVPFFMTFLPNLSFESLPILLLSIPLAFIHGFCEELFWRGLYVKTFGANFVWSVVIPTLFFALWHFSPQLAMPVENGIAFVVMVLPLGFIYGMIAYVTQSALWSAIAHGLSGVFAYSGYLALCVYEILFK